MKQLQENSTSWEREKHCARERKTAGDRVHKNLRESPCANTYSVRMTNDAILEELVCLCACVCVSACVGGGGCVRLCARTHTL